MTTKTHARADKHAQKEKNVKFSLVLLFIKIYCLYNIKTKTKGFFYNFAFCKDCVILAYQTGITTVEPRYRL
jgi:hypothetical protein